MERAAAAAEGPFHKKMAELRMVCQKEIRIRRQRSELTAGSFRDSLLSIKSKAEDNLANRVLRNRCKVYALVPTPRFEPCCFLWRCSLNHYSKHFQREKFGKLKDYLRKLETDLADALSVRTCKEAKRTAIAKSISAAISRSELLEKNVQDQRARKDEFATLISQQLLFLGSFEDKSNEDMNETKNIEEAIMWYKRVLGFRTEGGEGVKFIFNNIDLKNADEEYAFTVKLDGDIYKLMNCELCVEDINDLIKDLNKTNDLFKFVRIMRERFQAAALNVLPTKSSVIQDSTSITISSPPPFSVDSRNETPLKETVPHSQPKKPRLKSHQKVIPGQVAAPSPQSISNCRRSPRFVDKIFP